MRVRRPTMRRTKRLSLLSRFAIISFVLLVAVGLVLGRWLGAIQRERVLDDGRKNASIVAEAAAQPLLDPVDLLQDFVPIDDAKRQELDDSIGRAISADGIVRLKVWNAQHWIVWSDNPKLVGRWFTGDPALERALAGETNSLITDLTRPEEMEEQDFGRLLAVYVPIRQDVATGQFTTDGTGQVIGAFEIYVPYAPIAQALAEDLRTLYLSLAIGLVVLYLALFRLVAGASKRLRVQAALNAHQATHDLLTDLPNRRQLVDELQGMLDRRYGSKFVGLALLDVDRFKEINDALGHPSGDAVLQMIAQRFREQMPDTVVARIGGDEFAIAAENLPHAQAALALASRIEAVLHEPFEVAGISVSVRPSIGIALGPDDGRSADELLQHADVAMYVAKRTGSVKRLYSRNLDHYSPDRLSLAGELRDAIANATGDVHLAFQPKLDLRTDEITGVECLVRWKHPERGFVPPGEFLPIIENTELIAPLTWLVLDQALSTCATWRRHGLEIQMAVNISARTIGQPELYDRVVAALDTYGLPPSALELELTESALLGDHTVAAENVTRFRELGVSIAIDDFGTGYASIGYLTTMPISGLKIDRSFVDNMFSDPAAAAVVNFSLGLGQQLGLQIVAEGIEDEATLDEMRRLGCHTAQGYFISRPLGATEFLHWLLAWSTRHLQPRDIAPELDDPQPLDPDVPGYGGSPYELVGAGAPTAPTPYGSSPYAPAPMTSSPMASSPMTAGPMTTSPMAPAPQPLTAPPVFDLDELIGSSAAAVTEPRVEPPVEQWTPREPDLPATPPSAAELMGGHPTIGDTASVATTLQMPAAPSAPALPVTPPSSAPQMPAHTEAAPTPAPGPTLGSLGALGSIPAGGAGTPAAPPDRSVPPSMSLRLPAAPAPRPPAGDDFPEVSS